MLHDNLIINATSYISFNVHNQAVIHSLNVRRINYGAKFNLLALKKKKKTEGVPKFFLKGRQINFFKLYIYIYIFQVRGPPWP